MEYTNINNQVYYIPLHILNVIASKINSEIHFLMWLCKYLTEELPDSANHSFK